MAHAPWIPYPGPPTRLRCVHGLGVARWGQGLRGWSRRLGLAQIFCFGYHRLPRLPAPRQATPPLYHSEHALAGGHAPRLRSTEGAPCSRAEML